VSLIIIFTVKLLLLAKDVIQNMYGWTSTLEVASLITETSIIPFSLPSVSDDHICCKIVILTKIHYFCSFN